MKKNNGDKDIKDVVYRIGRHKFWLWFWLFVFVALSVVAGAFCIGFIERGFSKCSWWNNWDEENNKNNSVFNIGILPDFLGGMTGIVVGFILEWLVFEKIKHISKYQAILSCLKIEFEKIESVLNENEIFGIKEIVLDDIVLSAENSMILNNLPGYALLWKFRGSEKIFSLLQEIHGNIERRNRTLEEYDKEVKEQLNYWRIQNPNATPDAVDNQEREFKDKFICEPTNSQGEVLNSLIKTQIQDFKKLTLLNKKGNEDN